jgi:hypothetical protein
MTYNTTLLTKYFHHRCGTSELWGVLPAAHCRAATIPAATARPCTVPAPKPVERDLRQHQPRATGAKRPWWAAYTCHTCRSALLVNQRRWELYQYDLYDGCRGSHIHTMTMQAYLYDFSQHGGALLASIDDASTICVSNCPSPPSRQPVPPPRQCC